MRKIRRKYHIDNKIVKRSHADNMFYRNNSTPRDCMTNLEPCRAYESAKCDFTCDYAKREKALEIAIRNSSDSRILPLSSTRELINS